MLLVQVFTDALKTILILSWPLFGPCLIIGKLDF